MTTTIQTQQVNVRLAQLAKATKTTTGEFYALVGHTGGEVNLDDADYAETLRIFRHGACVAFAYATALISGLPIALFTVSQQGESWSGHAAIQLPTGDFFDIAGTTSQNEISSHFGFNVEPSIHENPATAQAIISSDAFGEDGAFGYLLTHVNELGLLVTFHFVEQLLSYSSIDFDETLLRELEQKTTAYARKVARKAK